MSNHETTLFEQIVDVTMRHYGYVREVAPTSSPMAIVLGYSKGDLVVYVCASDRELRRNPDVDTMLAMIGVKVRNALVEESIAA